MNKAFIEVVAAAVELVVKYDDAGRKKVLEVLPDKDFTIEDLKQAMKLRRPDESVQPKI
jgi:hypothetical protein